MQDVPPHLLVQRPLAPPEDLRDLHPREDRRARPQEELARLPVERQVAIRPLRQPAPAAPQTRHLRAEAFPAHRRIRVVERGELQLGDRFRLHPARFPIGPCASQLPLPRRRAISAWKRSPRIDGSVWSNAGSSSSVTGAVDILLYFFFGLTACFNEAPAENLGAFEALILTRSPVRGLTPWRAALLTTENLPKPVMLTSSPFFKVFVTVSNSDSIARPESALLRPLSDATASTS